MGGVEEGDRGRPYPVVGDGRDAVPGAACVVALGISVARYGLSSRERARRTPVFMLHARSDLSRRGLDCCLLGEDGERLEATIAAPDAEGSRGLVRGIAERRERAHDT